MRDPNVPPFWQWFKDYLSFHSQEKNRILALVAVILILSAIQIYLSFKTPERNLASIEFLGAEHFVKLEAQMDSAKIAKEKSYKHKKYGKVEVDYKPFNPNELDSAGWRAFGLSPKQSQVMVKIRVERGGFKSKEELSRINILSFQFQKMRPFIQLPDTTIRKTWPKRKFENTVSDTSVGKWPKKTWPKREYKKLNIELNGADSTDLVQLYGIGPSFAKRIIKYRTSLGGFISKNQLQEVWGMDSARYAGISDEILVDAKLVNTININTSTLEQLKEHPYIRYNLARAIVNYRKQHGVFKAVSNLKKIHLVTDEVYRKIAPYLQVR